MSLLMIVCIIVRMKYILSCALLAPGYWPWPILGPIPTVSIPHERNIIDLYIHDASGRLAIFPHSRTYALSR